MTIAGNANLDSPQPGGGGTLAQELSAISGGGSSTWNGGTVSALGANLAINSGTLVANVPVTTVAGRTGSVVVTSTDLADFSTAVVANAPVKAVDASLVSNSGTVGLGTIAATSILGNAGTTAAQPTALALNPANFVVSGGTVSTSGTVATVNVTSASGYQINGTAVLNIDQAGTSQATYLGVNAGLASAGSTGLGCTFLGNGAGQSMTSAGSENTFVGAIAGQKVTTGAFLTALGEHAMGYELTPTSSVAIGNDCMRNWVSTGSNTAVGKSAMQYGGGSLNTAVGFQALFGNATVIKFTGTPTAGDSIPVVFTGTFTGSPRTVTYTVPASPTLASVATGVAAAINADSVVGTGGTSGLNNGAGLAAVTDSNNVQIQLAGTATTGVSCVVSCTVTGTTVCTITGGAMGTDNVALGDAALQGKYLSSGSLNVGIGKNTLYSLTSGGSNFAAVNGAGFALTSGSNNILIGTSAGAALTTVSTNIAIGPNALSTNAAGANTVAIGNSAAQNWTGNAGSTTQAITALGVNAYQGATGASGFSIVAVGASALKSATNCHNVTVVGANAGALITSGSTNTIFGDNVASTTLTTGTGNILIGTGSGVDTAAAGTSNTINLGAVFLASGINTPSTAAAYVSNSFGIGGSSGPTWTSGAGAPSGTQPVGSLYSNTSGTTGSRLYVSAGSGTWNAVSGV